VGGVDVGATDNGEIESKLTALDVSVPLIAWDSPTRLLMVGAAEGASVCVADGLALGKAEGLIVGCSVGMSDRVVNSSTGASDGDPVGTADAGTRRGL
jgi:hypothetical protein